MPICHDQRVPLTDPLLRLGDSVFELDTSAEVGRGSTCLVYRAWEYDDTDTPRRVILKEFYPLEPDCGSRRNLDGSLTLPQDSAAITVKKARFCQSYHLFKTFFNRDELNLYTVQAQKLIGAREAVNGTMYMVVDYGSAVSMDEYLASEPGLYDFLSVMKNLARILGRIHNAGYLHMDLKPANLLCFENGLVRLMDTDSFLRKADFRGEDSASLILSASRGYAAPEVLQYTGDYLQRKRFAATGQRADIYSFGAILYRYLFGQTFDDSVLPWEPWLEQALQQRERNIPGKAVTLIRALLEAALNRVSAGRQSSMDEVLRQLEDILPLVNPAKPRIVDNFRRTPCPIVGRERALTAVREALAQQTEASRLVIISGPGGIGKSALAKAYAQACADSYDIIAEVSASGAAEAVQRIPIANWEPEPEWDLPTTVDRCKKKLSELCREFKTLLIIHDYDVSEDEQFAIFYELGCDILLTSRHDWTFSGIPTVCLGSADLTPEASEAIFRQYYLQHAEAAQDHTRAAQLQSFLRADREALGQLLCELNYHPLGIKLMARQMAAVPGRELLPAQALAALHQEGFSRDSDRKYQNDQVGAIRFSNSYRHLAAIFRISLTGGIFRRTLVEAMRYMTLVSAPWGISAGRFAALTGMDPAHLEALRQLGWVEYLSRRQDLLDRRDHSGIYIMPLVIQEVLRKEPEMACAGKNSAGFLEALARPCDGLPSRQARLALFDQQKILVQALAGEGSLDYARLLQAREYNLSSMDGGKTAGELLVDYAQQRLDIYRQHSGTEAQQLDCCNRLSRYCYELGDWNRSRVYTQQAMDLEAAHSLAVSRDTLSARLGYANLLWERGQWDDAIVLTKKLFDDCTRLSPADPLLTLNTWYNSGYFLLRTCSFQAAEKLLLDLTESPLLSTGNDMQTQLLTLSLYRLGQLYLENGLADSALECFRQSLEIHTHRWGTGHLFQAGLHAGLAEGYLLKQDAEAALSCHAKELEVYYRNPGAQPYRESLCLGNLALDCFLIPEREELGGQFWQQACQHIASWQQEVEVRDLSDLRDLMHHLAKRAFREGLIHEGLEKVEDSVRLYSRVPDSTEELIQEYRTLAGIFTHYGLSGRGDYYRMLSQNCSD